MAEKAGADWVEILMVEDNLDDAELTLRSLRKHNLTRPIYHAKDGEEAVNFLFGTGSFGHRSAVPCPRVVLLDLKLPKLDGFEVLRRIRNDARTRRLPVVAVTSSRQDRDISMAYDLGANSYIVKPVDGETFSKILPEVGRYWLQTNQAPT